MDCGRFSMGAVLFFFILFYYFLFGFLDFLNFDFQFCWDSPHHVRVARLATHRPFSSGTQPGIHGSVPYGSTTYLITCGSLS